MAKWEGYKEDEFNSLNLDTLQLKRIIDSAGMKLTRISNNININDVNSNKMVSDLKKSVRSMTFLINNILISLKKEEKK